MSDSIPSFCDQAVAGIRQLKPYEPGKPMSELAREYGVSDIIKLASNENPLGPSPAAIEAGRAVMSELALYPDGNGFALKQKLAQKHHVDPACITLGNGSNDVLEFVARTFLTSGLNAVFSAHAFAVYPLVTMAVGADLHIAAPQAPDSAMPYGHDLDSMRQQIDDKTRVIFIANPNNPTGTWLDKDVLEAFIRDVPSHVIIVLDEAYVEYVQDDDYPDSLPWLQHYPNLVISRTFSKAYGLAGLRIGYAISHPDIADLLNRVRQPFNTNAVAQAAAEAALGDVAHIDSSVQMNTAGLQQISQGLNAMQLEYIPSVANFISFKTPLPGAEVYDRLLHAGIIIRPISNYGMPDFLRVTVGTEQQNRRFLDALGQIMGETR